MFRSFVASSWFLFLLLPAGQRRYMPMALLQSRTQHRHRHRYVPIFIVPTDKERDYEVRNLFRSEIVVDEDDSETPRFNPNNHVLLSPLLAAISGFLVAANLLRDAHSQEARLVTGLVVAILCGLGVIRTTDTPALAPPLPTTNGTDFHANATDEDSS
jgi:hypothetical protein